MRLAPGSNNLEYAVMISTNELIPLANRRSTLDPAVVCISAAADEITFLRTTGNLLATKRWKADGSVEAPATHPKNFTLSTERVSTLSEFHAALNRHATDPQTMMIRGRYIGDERRAQLIAQMHEKDRPEPGCILRRKSFFDDQPLHIVMFDIDGAKTTVDPLTDPEGAIQEWTMRSLPSEFHEADFSWQLSSSAGHPTKTGLRAHVFFWLSEARTSAELKAWAKQIRLPVDVGVFNELQEHFTAHPVFDPGVHDPVVKRFGLFRGLISDSVVIDTAAVYASISAAAQTALLPLMPLTKISPEQEAHLRSALQHREVLEAMKDRDVWVRDIGIPLLSIGDKGRELFCWVSRQAPNYDPGCDVRWWSENAHYKTKLDFRHIYRFAAQMGWKNPIKSATADCGDFTIVASDVDPQPLVLQRTINGPRSNVRNATMVLARQTFVALSFDEFLDRVIVGWPGESNHPLSDADVTRIQIQLQHEGMVTMSATSVSDAINLVARRNPTNVITAYLESLQWDRARRLSLLLQRGFGTAATRYHVRAGRNMLLAMVARAYQPGCQVDEALVFEGPQGKFKSSALRALGGTYFKELTADPNSKDFEHQLRGTWLGEFPELHAMRRTDDIARIKQFITNREDHYRPPYGREMRDYPRRTVLCGTTNEEHWIHDPTGGRRFIPVEVGTIDLQWLRDNRDQLFAEAVTLYKAHRKWWIYPRAETLAQQETRAPEDPWTSNIRAYLQGRIEIIDPAEVLEHALCIHADRQTSSQLTRVGIILRKLGCTAQGRRRIGGIRRKPWTVPIDISSQPCIRPGPVAFPPVQMPMDGATPHSAIGGGESLI